MKKSADLQDGHKIHLRLEVSSTVSQQISQRSEIQMSLSHTILPSQPLSRIQMSPSSPVSSLVSSLSG